MPEKENLLEKYQKMSNIDVKFLSKLYYGNHELEMRRMQKIMTDNSLFQ